MRRWCLGACLSILAFPFVGAEAADLSVRKAAPATVVAPASPWEFQFTPYAWIVSLYGDQRLGDRTGKIDTNLFKILDKSDHIYAWMSYQELRNGPYSVYANVVWTRMGVSDTRTGVFPINNFVTANAVATADIWVDFAIIEPGFTYEFARWSSGAPGTAGATSTALDLVGGARYWLIRPDIDLNVTATVSIPALGLSRTVAGNASATKTIDWWDPFVGLRLRHKPARGHEIVLQGDVGGFDVGSKFTWQALGTYNFDTQLFGLRFVSYLGYRALSIDYEQGTGDQLIGLKLIHHGPVIGATFRW